MDSYIPLQRAARIVVAALIAVGFSGCVDETSKPPDHVFGDPFPDPYSTSRMWMNGTCPCFESTLAVAPDGTTYVTSALKPQILVHTDGEFVATSAPPFPAAVPPGTVQNDALVQTDADSRLHYHALLTRQDNNAFLLLGIQYAMSQDRGLSWQVNTILNLPDAMDAPQLGADRQWLTIAGDGTMYMTYQRVSPDLGVVGQTLMGAGMDPRGLRISTSLDEGRSWSTFRTITGDENRITVINGQPVANEKGMLFIPFFSYGPNARLEVAISSDGGVSFSRHPVFSPEDRSPGAWFPSLATHEGGLLIVWVGPGQALYGATSPDGKSWSPPELISPPGAALAASPWVSTSREEAAIIWYNRTSEDTAQLMVTMGWPGSGTHQVLVSDIQGWPSKPAYTDFAHGHFRDENTLAAIWSTQDGFGIAETFMAGTATT